MEKRIIIFTPTEAEATPLAGSMVPDGYKAELVVCGVGMAETAASVARTVGSGTRPAMAILAGIAGAYTGLGLKTGDCVVVTTEKIADLGAVREGIFEPLYEKEYLCPLAGRVASLPKASSLTVNCIGGPHEAQAHTAGYRIENMEGAAFFAVCTALNIPFLEIRAISNMTGDRRSDWRIPEALEALADGVRGVLGEPVALGI